MPSRVLITRPQAQAARLIDGVRALDLHPVALPCLSIEPAPPPAGPPPRRGAAIFTSRNAVEHAVRHDGWPWRGVRALAIGPATAAALARSGRPALFAPREPFDSEALLAQLAGETPTGGPADVVSQALNDGITIVTGEGGRPTLGEALQARGHRVQRRELYRRRLARPSAEQIEAALSPPPDLVSTSSDAVLDALVQLITDSRDGAQRLERLRGTPLLVNGDRCADHARAAGFHARLLVARPAGDAGQLAALTRWKAGEDTGT